MSWIKTVPYIDATGKLKKLYDRIKGPDDNVDNIMMSHSLRPHTMEGHMAIYKNVLHHTGNTLPEWFLELIGVWVSALNECDYCVEHHFAGMKRLLGDDARADTLREAIEDGDVDVAPLTDAEKMALGYAAMLTLTPSKVPEEAIKALRSVGFEDGEILEINQVTAYFNYANRTVLGLGCDTEGDVIGLSPNNSDNPDDWNHS
ncbi:carboxymuconolactone decarboxylase family protein [Profundibacter amoris]|uniref:Alkylhydroperoxidase n=1 Tax=Profundibacter amoris TaxID=2171755 RepID=A0A347UIK1_9RHOB|nr:peroxidase-related enzyme [Profundibacter amoris]AXX98679.1 alkylhydroperoxidase [Profundibacter amoris]